MGGALRSLLCFGISSAKFRKIFSRHLCLSVYWLTKELLREPLLYLPGERQEQPVSSFVWSSCENARRPGGGPGGESWMCQVGVGAAATRPAHHGLASTTCSLWDSVFLQADLKVE